MAIDTTITCTKCGQDKTVTHSIGDYPTVCDECEDALKDKERRDFLGRRMKLTTPERLALIERDLYELSKQAQQPAWDGRIG